MYRGESKFDKVFSAFSLALAHIIVVLPFFYIIRAHGDVADSTPINWGDVFWALFFVAVYISCVIDLYKFYKEID